MNSKKMFYVMCGLAGLFVVALVTATYFGNTLLTQRAEKLQDLKLESKVIEQQQTELARAKEDIEAFSELESIAASVVPQEKDQARTVREIVRIAGNSGVGISSVTFPSSTLGGAGARRSGETQVTPVPGISGVSQLAINVTSASGGVTYPQLIDFLQKLEQNRRTAQVSSVTISPISGSRTRVTFTIQLNVYIKS